MKNQKFCLSKASMGVLQTMETKTSITLCTNRKTLALEFIDHNNGNIHRAIMMNLLNRYLIRYEYRNFKFELTKMGKRLVKLGNQKPNSLIISNVNNKSQDIAISMKSRLL